MTADPSPWPPGPAPWGHPGPPAPAALGGGGAPPHRAGGPGTGCGGPHHAYPPGRWLCIVAS